MILRRVRHCLVLLTCLMLLAGCGGVGPEEETVEVEIDIRDLRSGTIVIGLDGELAPPDANAAAGSSVAEVLVLLGDPILERHPETGDLVEHLARRWWVSRDGTRVYLSLRDDVFYHSGEALDARTLATDLQRIMESDPETARRQMGPVETIVAEDALRLRIDLSEPFAPILRWLGCCAWGEPFNVRTRDAHGSDGGPSPGGVGPYRFDERVPGTSIRLVRNEDYLWVPGFYQNDGPAYPAEVVLRHFPEEPARIAALEAGEIHITRVPVTAVQRFTEDSAFRVIPHPTTGISMSVVFNCERPPTDDLRVRQALASAIDAPSIIDQAAAGRAEIASGPLPSTSWGYWKDMASARYPHDLDRAESLLDDAGWTRNAETGLLTRRGETLELTLALSATDQSIRTAEVLAQGWARLGVRLVTEVLPEGEMSHYLADGHHGAALIGYDAPEDPDWLFRLFHSSEIGQPGGNPHRLSSARLDLLLETQRSTMDPEVRREHLRQAQRSVLESALQTPIYILTEYVALDGRVRDFFIDYRGTWRMHDMWLEK